ncbi:unnamed protein product [Somion occarium]|uniref:BRCT domain-containing protein n=1 Tax=Somion occarium TaxID=3059160 RepID=A0ABP1E455_9APHY
MPIPLQLFHGQACFSPSIAQSTVKAWVMHGGTLAQTKQEKSQADYYFCADSADPWLPSLLQNPIVVFHAAWITRSVEAKVLLPCAYFVLDQPTPLAKSMSAAIPVNSRPEVTPRRGTVRKRQEVDHDTPDSDRRPRKKTRRAELKIQSPSSPLSGKDLSVRFSSPPAAKERDLKYVKMIQMVKPLELKLQSCISRTQPSSCPQAWKDLLEKTQTISPIPRVLVSDALHALRDVSTGRSTLFEPEGEYGGKLFRCFRKERT